MSLRKLFNNVNSYAVNNKKRFILILLSIVVVNFLVAMYFNYRSLSSTNSSIDTLLSAQPKNLGFDDSKDVSGHIDDDISVIDYYRLTKLQDTLQTLMNTGLKTSKDTATFLRIYKEFEKIDPSIKDDIKSINKQINKNNQ